MKRFLKTGIKLAVIASVLAGFSYYLVAGTSTVQKVDLVSSKSTLVAGDTFTVSAMYDVGDGNKALSGIGFQIFFDETKLEFTGNSNVLATNQLAYDTTPLAKSGNPDSDATTNKFLGYSWADFTSPPKWPGGTTPSAVTLPLKLADLGFRVKTGVVIGPTHINIVVIDTDPAYAFAGTNAAPTIIIPPGSITGTVSYTGAGTGATYVGAWDNVSFTGSYIGYATANATTGAYTIANLPPTSYYLQAFKANSGNSAATGPTLTDPKIQITTAKVVAPGAATTGVNITLLPGPTVTGLTNDTAPRQSKTWTWDSNPTGGFFRFLVDQNTTWEPADDVQFGDTKTATQLTGDATYYIHVQAMNGDGTAGPVTTVSALLDNTKPPVGNVVLSPSVGPDRFVKAGAVTFTITFGKDMNTNVPPMVTFIGSAGIQVPPVSGTGFTNARTWVGSYTVTSGTGDGIKTITISGAQDLAGNFMLPNTGTQFTVDTTPPVTTLSLTPGTYGTTQKVTMTKDEAGTIYWRLYTQPTDPGTATLPTTAYTPNYEITLTAGGANTVTEYYLVYYAADALGNKEAVRSAHYTINTNAPVTNVTFVNTTVQPTLYNTIYYTKAASTDVLLASPQNTIFYTVSDTGTPPADPVISGDGSGPSVTLTAAAEGTYIIKYRAKNLTTSLMEAVTTKTLVVDRTAPAAPVVTPAVTTPTNVQPQTVAGTKEANTAVWVNTLTTGPVFELGSGTGWSYSQSLVEGNNVVTLTAVDAAGNISNPTPVAILYDVTKPVTSGWNPARNTTTPQPLNKQVIAHITDAGSGINVSSIKVNVSGTEYGYGGNLAISYSTLNDVTVTFTPPAIYAPSTTIPVKIDARDNAGNVMVQDSYTFPTGARVSLDKTAIGLATGSPFTFTASGGSQPYTWARTPESGSTLTPSSTTADFTATVVGVYTVTVTDNATATANATVTVVNPIAVTNTSLVKGTNDHFIMKSGTQTQFAFTGGSGAVNWAASGTNTGTFGTNGTYTAPTVPGTVTVTVTDNTYANITNQFQIDIYPGITVATAGGVQAVKRGDTLQFGAVGGTGVYNWSVTPPSSAGAIGLSTGLFTPAGTGVLTFTATATDAAAPSYISGTSGTITVMDPLVITSTLPIKNERLYMKSGTAATFAFTGGRGAGNVVWTCTAAGAIDPNTGVFTAPPVTTKQTVTITATDKDFSNITYQTLVDVYPALVIKMGSQIKTGGTIFVPNKAGNNTKVITVEGGSGAFTWNLAADAKGTLSGTTGSPNTFTATVDAVSSEAGELLTITDNFDPTLLTAYVRIKVVNFGITKGRTVMLKGLAEVYETTGAAGAVTWKITAGATDPKATKVDGVAKTTVTATALGTFTIEATDGDSGATDTKLVEVLAPIRVTTPGNVVAVARGATLQFSATGGKAPYVWSVPTDAGTIDPASGLFTPAAGTAKKEFMVTVTDAAAYSAPSALVTIIDPLVITNTSLTKNASGNFIMKSGTQTPVPFAFTGGSGKVSWVASGTPTGVFGTDGAYTAPTVTGSQPVQVTVTVTDKEFGNISLKFKIDIYPGIAVSTAGDVKAVKRGGTLQFTAAGGTGAYQWSVPQSAGSIDSSGLFTPAAGTEVLTFTATAADAAASYVTGTSATITVMNPLVITSILPMKSERLYMQSGATTPFTSTGGRAGNVVWTSTAGTINPTTGAFTAPTVTTKQTVTITATDNLFGNITFQTEVDVYPSLVIKVGSEIKTGGTIYVPNKTPNNTRLITVEGGSGTYTWTLAAGAKGMLSGTTGASNNFTATPDAISVGAGEQLTITDDFDPVVFKAATTIKVVDFGITAGRTVIVKGQPAIYDVTGTIIGNVTWQITPGATNPGASKVESGTKNSRATVTATAVGTFTITATDSLVAGSTGSMEVTVVNPLEVKTPGNVLAVKHGSTLQFSATGGKGTYTWSVSTVSGDNAGSISADTGLFTPAGIGIKTFKAKATDAESYFVESALITVVDPLAISTTSTTVPSGKVHPGDTIQFARVSGGSGSVKWSTTGGNYIDTATGKFTAPAVTASTSTSIVVTATDSQFGNITFDTNVTAYPKVTITNQPSTPPTIKPGEKSVAYTVAGGDGGPEGKNYTWTVEKLGAVVGDQFFGSSFVFTAPSEGSFAGKYTIKVKDSFMADPLTFDVYVPLKVVPWDTTDDGKVITPVMLTVANKYALKVYGVTAGTLLTATKDDPTSTVLTLPVPPTTENNLFAVTPTKPGVENVTIRVTNAADGSKYQGEIRIDVLGVAQLSGTIGNIPSGFDKSTITVELFDGGKAPLAAADYGVTSVSVNNSGVYAFTGPGGAGLRWQAYWLQVTVKHPDYVPAVTGKRILVSDTTVTANIDLPVLALKECNLTVDVKNGLGSQYVTGEAYSYKFFLASSNNVMLEGTVNPGTDTFTVALERKNYRLIITGEKYLPYEYEDLTPPTKFIKIGVGEANKTVFAPLTRLAATVYASNTVTEKAYTDPATSRDLKGVTLKVVTKNFTTDPGTLYLNYGGIGKAVLVNDGGDGTEQKPYVFTWTPEGVSADADLNVICTIPFTFKNSGVDVMNPDGTVYTYNVKYEDYASDEEKKKAKEDKEKNKNASDQDHWKDQQDLARDNTTVSVTLQDREFFPLLGTTVAVTLNDVNGARRDVSIVIPPLPLEYLYVDDFDTAAAGGDKLLYGRLKSATPPGTDRYGQTKALAKNVLATDILRVRVEYVTIAGGAPSNAVSLSLETREGVRVRYNPLLKNDAGGYLRDDNAPVISLPLLLNTKSLMFKVDKKLSDAKGKLKTLVSELGDGQNGTHEEPLSFTVQDDGLVWVDMNHLSSLSLGSIGSGGESSSSSSGSSSGCFIATAAYGSYFEKHVQILRNFRDVYLLTNDWGRAFVGFYYRHSPAIADAIAKSGALRATVRLGLAPVVGVAYVTIHTTPVQKILILLFLIGILAAGMVMILRTRKFRRVIG